MESVGDIGESQFHGGVEFDLTSFCDDEVLAHGLTFTLREPC